MSRSLTSVPLDVTPLTSPPSATLQPTWAPDVAPVKMALFVPLWPIVETLIVWVAPVSNAVEKA